MTPNEIGSQPGVLPREQLIELLGGETPLVTGLRDIDQQVQPNGIDLTLASVSELRGPLRLGVSDEDRVLPEVQPLAFEDGDFVHLPPGCYSISLNEVVHLPTDVMALGRPRSSLNRGGVTLHTAIWDAGYNGRSTSLLAVLNSDGFEVQRNARVLQLVFFRMSSAAGRGYEGIYQGENLETDE